MPVGTLAAIGVAVVVLLLACGSCVRRLHYSLQPEGSNRERASRRANVAVARRASVAAARRASLVAMPAPGITGSFEDKEEDDGEDDQEEDELPQLPHLPLATSKKKHRHRHRHSSRKHHQKRKKSKMRKAGWRERARVRRMTTLAAASGAAVDGEALLAALVGVPANDPKKKKKKKRKRGKLRRKSTKQMLNVDDTALGAAASGRRQRRHSSKRLLKMMEVARLREQHEQHEQHERMREEEGGGEGGGGGERTTYDRARRGSLMAAHAQKKQAGRGAGPPTTDREALVKLYRRAAPDKLGNISAILARFAGKSEQLYALLDRMFPNEIVERPVAAAAVPGVAAAAGPGAFTRRSLSHRKSQKRRPTRKPVERQDTSLAPIGEKKNDLSALLAKARLTAFAERMAAFGIESVTDLASGDVTDEDLTSAEIGMAMADVQRLRAALLPPTADSDPIASPVSDLDALLASVKLTAFAERMAAFGIESVEDLASGDVTDEDLTGAQIGMKPLNVRRLRAALAERSAEDDDPGVTSPLNDDLDALLAKAQVTAFAERMAAFGIESVEDLASDDVADEDLMGAEIGMGIADVQRLRGAQASQRNG